MGAEKTVHRVAAGRSAAAGRCEIRSGRQVGAARHSGRRGAETDGRAAGHGDTGEKVRDGAEHQNGADETDAGASAAVGQPADAGAATAGAGADVSVSGERHDLSND